MYNNVTAIAPSHLPLTIHRRVQRQHTHTLTHNNTPPPPLPLPTSHVLLHLYHPSLRISTHVTFASKVTNVRVFLFQAHLSLPSHVPRPASTLVSARATLHHHRPHQRLRTCCIACAACHLVARYAYALRLKVIYSSVFVCVCVVCR